MKELNSVQIYIEYSNLHLDKKTLGQKIKIKIACEDLKIAKQQLMKTLSNDAAIQTKDKIEVILKYSFSSMKVKLDWSLMKNKRTVDYLKSFLENS